MMAINNRRRFIIVLFLFIGLAFTLNPVWAYDAKFAENVTVHNVFEMLNFSVIAESEYENVKIFLIDVRTQQEFQFMGYIPRAYNIPYCFLSKNFILMDQEFEYAPGAMHKSHINHYPLVKNPDFLKYVKQLVTSTNDRIIVYGRDSRLSAKAADDVVKAGYNHVINMIGGLESTEIGWKSADLPLNYMFFVKDLDPRYIYPPDVSNIPEKAKYKIR
ncbi:MAG: rhodanese-like domain-containing protein [bacterium]